MHIAVFSKRFTKTAICVFSAVALTALAAVLLSFCFSGSSEKGSDYSFDLSETGGVSGFLSQFSLEFESEENVREITIPAKDDETFKEYNRLQREIGLNILKFSGKNVEERYIKLKNKNSKNQRLYAVVYVYKSRIIGAHLTTLLEGSENLPLTAFV